MHRLFTRPGRAMVSFFLFAVLAAALPGCAGKPAPVVDAAPIQSPSDTRAYRLVTLPNGLEALLISDPDTPKAAASLDVRVGSGDNPRGRAGLAHFLEHMLFLGTDKYPDPAEYERFITEHGGSRNAYTSLENTNYFFDVDAAHLTGALDRFAQFFVSPNFDAAYVERERNAVEAEYQMGLKSDGRRGFDVLQASVNPAHPYSQFTVGSLETLADRPDATVRDDLIAFYERYYSANIMRLAVLGRESLDELEALVRQQFAEVPNRDVTLEPVDAPIFREGRLPMLLQIEPLGTARELQVNFPIPDYRDDYDAKPLSYVGNLVGHEGEGSLLSALKREGLADALSAGDGLSWRGGALFSVSVSLTEQGVERYERVLQLLFSYLDRLRDAGPEAWRYNEQSAIAELGFRFREPTEPIRYVMSLSSAMQQYRSEDILRGPYLMARFDPALIGEALAALVPERAQVVLTAPGVATEQRSAYYDVPYTRLGPEALMLSRWTADMLAGELQLPAPNPFIAEDLSLLPLADDNPPAPALRHESTRKRIWYRQAADFRVPKGVLYASFRSPQVSGSAEQRAAAALYTRLVSDTLNEFTYPARLAGLGFDFYRHQQGITLRISGYNDKQLPLLRELLETIAIMPIDSQRFERLRRDMVLQLQNTVARRPTSQLLDHLRQALVSGEFSDEALVAALEAMDESALDGWRKAFWESARAEALVYGNHPKGAVDEVAATLDRVLQGAEGEPAQAPTILALAEGERLQLETAIAHDDSVLAWYLQATGQSLEDRAAMALTAQVIQSGFFQQLRTEQQLGYVVSSFAWPQYDVPGLLLLVQSPSHDATTVYRAMADFLAAVPDDIDAEQFERHRRALINDILKPQDNLMERAGFYWQSIALRDWDFAQPRELAAAVEAFDLGRWSDYFQRNLLAQPRSLLAASAGKRELFPDAAPSDSRFSDPQRLADGRPRYTADLEPL